MTDKLKTLSSGAQRSGDSMNQFEAAAVVKPSSWPTGP